MPIKNLHLFFCLLLCFFAIAACDKHSDPVEEPDSYVVPDPPAKGSTAKRTVLIYVVGDNNLGRDGFANSDLQEIEDAVKVLPASLYSYNNMLVFYDQYASSSYPVLFRIVKEGKVQPMETDPTKTELIVSAKREILKEYSQEVTSTEPALIEEVMKLAFSTFPAESYGFVYWSHGDGWLPGKYRINTLRSMDPLRWIGVDWDGSSGDTSSSYKTGITEFAEVLKKAPKKLDFLLLDACFMLSVEVAYELRDCTNYVIGSPTETPGPGASYGKLVSEMFGSNPGIKIAEEYFNFYNEKYNPDVTNTNTNWTAGVSVTSLDCRKLSSLAMATDANLPSEITNCKILRTSVFDYDKRNTTFYSSNYVGYFDMVGLMKSVMSSDKFAVWKKTYDETVAYWHTTSKNYSSAAKLFSMEGANGVTHYIPSTAGSTAEKDVQYRSTSWYKDAGLKKIGW